MKKIIKNKMNTKRTEELEQEAIPFIIMQDKNLCKMTVMIVFKNHVAPYYTRQLHNALR